MPRIPDLPCAVCGTLMYRSKTSLPEGEATCQPCRKKLQEDPRPCKTCGKEFEGTPGYYCGACRYAKEQARGKNNPTPCAECDAPSQFRGLCPKHYWRDHKARTDPDGSKRRAREKHTKRTTYTKECGYCGASFDTSFARGQGCTTAHGKYIKQGRTLASDQSIWKLINVKPIIKPIRHSNKSALRQAYENQDSEAILEAIKDRSVQDENGCWNWPSLDRSGYGKIRWGTKGSKQQHLVHRLASLAAHGEREDVPVVHHVCANRACCNPEHIQPVTHRENIAEMLERNYYKTRLQELEAALRDLDPTHPLVGKWAS